MTSKTAAMTVIALVCLIALSGLAAAQSAEPLAPAASLGAGFTYQGQLMKQGEPYNGDCDMTFRLYDALVDGTQLGGDQLAKAVGVTRGLFTVALLDFGSAAFGGERRWLEVEVVCPPGGDRGLISPRQELTAAPYAAYAAGNWGLTGNSGTTASTNYLGTRDNQALELKVSGARALRIEPVGLDSPNLIGGYPSNAVQAGAFGATIAGGGLRFEQNVVTDNYGAVGGGAKNRAGDSSAATSDKPYGTVGGGYSNTASGIAATVGGGSSNTASGSHATVAGGETNAAGGDDATVAGGISNSAGSAVATVGGGDTNTASGSAATVAGGYHNTAGAANATVAGGSQNAAQGASAVIAGGYLNAASASSTYATIGGGHTNAASSAYATVAGGHANSASGYAATASGGESNTAGADYTFAAGRRAKSNHAGSFVWGDSTNADVASTAPNQFLARASGGVNLQVGSGGWRIVPQTISPSMIGGSSANTANFAGATIAGGGAVGATCGGGTDPCWNRVENSGGTIGGGESNSAGFYATVAGGTSNTASGGWAAVGGGIHNTAGGLRAVVSGGEANIASGDWATVAGGFQNVAGGANSFAAGQRAKATNVGSFVWADSTPADFGSMVDNSFWARASGGFRFYTNPEATTGSSLAPGSMSWSTGSDRNVKANFSEVDAVDLLERLAGIPITTWNYTTQDPAIRHIGPAAQDFSAAFAVGEDDTHISTVDADGVSLAAIQGLYELVQELQAKNAALEARLADLEGRTGSEPEARGVAR